MCVCFRTMRWCYSVPPHCIRSSRSSAWLPRASGTDSASWSPHLIQRYLLYCNSPYLELILLYLLIALTTLSGSRQFGLRLSSSALTFILGLLANIYAFLLSISRLKDKSGCRRVLLRSFIFKSLLLWT